MSNGLIRQGTLRRLRRRFGPKNIEGVIYVRRDTIIDEPNGTGKIKVKQRLGPYPSRVSFNSYYRSREEIAAGRPQGEHRYLFEMVAGYDILPTDKIEYIGQEWQPDLSVSEGLLFRPSIEDGHFYRSITGGITGSSPPVWSALRGSIFTDGTVTWQDMGKYNLFEVIEIEQVDSYEIVRDVYCDLAQ